MVRAAVTVTEERCSSNIGYQTEWELERERLLGPATPNSDLESDDNLSSFGTEIELQANWRQRMVLWLDSSKYAHYWDCFEAAINIAFCAIYGNIQG